MKMKANCRWWWSCCLAAGLVGATQVAVGGGLGTVCPAAEGATTWQVVGVDGKAISAASLEIDAKGSVKVPDISQPLLLDDLRAIEVAGAQVTLGKPNLVAVLPSNGQLFADAVTIANERLTFQIGKREVVLPIDAVRAIRLAPALTHEPFDATLANPSAEQDTIYFRTADRTLVSAIGLTESFTSEKLSFDWEGQSRTIDRDQLWGIVFAGTAQTAGLPPATVVMRDGSTLPGRISQADDTKLTLTIGGSQTELPWSLIARLEIRSSRVAYLSDLTPTQSIQTPLVTAPFPSRPDLNVLGQPLRLGSQSFEKGWGTHAEARLVFDTADGYDWLLGTIGHDPASRGRGDCVISVLGDGRELFSSRLKGSDAPLDLRVSVQGMQKVTLVVEGGEDLDLADHVNWCDLRFLRQPSERP